MMSPRASGPPWDFWPQYGKIPSPSMLCLRGAGQSTRSFSGSPGLSTVNMGRYPSPPPSKKCLQGAG